MKILVAEDDRGAQAMVKRMLSPYARQIELFENLKDLKEAMRRSPDTDIVLLDLYLKSPAEETASTVPEVRELCPRAVVVLMSGTVDRQELVDTSKRVNADAYIYKPEMFTRAGLLRVLLAVLLVAGKTGRSDTFEQHLKMMEAYVESLKHP